MNAGELLALLRRHYVPESRPPGGVFAPEIESPDGKRRADAMWMPTTWAERGQLVGHEIKVTRADVLAELADPTKADAWARYCTRWWLVVADQKLVEGLDVPETWGVLAPPSGRRTRSMTVVREAPKLQPADPARAFQRMAVWLAHRAHDAEASLARQQETARRVEESLQRQLRELRAAGARVGPVDPLEELVRRVAERVRLDLRDGAWRVSDVDEDAVVAGLLDLGQVQGATERARRSLSTAVRQAQYLTEGVKRMATELDKIQLPELQLEVPA